MKGIRVSWESDKLYSLRWRNDCLKYFKGKKIKESICNTLNKLELPNPLWVKDEAIDVVLIAFWYNNNNNNS